MISIEELHKLFLKSTSISTDSRNCPKGSIFFALKGDSFDGNKYASVALNNGAEYAIIDDASLSDTPNCLFTSNVLDTLQKLARFHRDTFNIPVIGITGTNGKTTTKELLAAVLKQKFNTLYTEGNFNNHIGVPLTLLKLNKSHEIAIIEMGANHPGEIAELCKIANPSHGVITNVGKAHLEGFGSFENVIKTKSELYTYLKENNNTLFFNTTNTHLNEAAKSSKTINYSTKGTNNSKSSVINDLPFLQIQLSNENEKHILNTHLTGRYNYDNIIASIAIGEFFDISIKSIITGIESYIPTNNRSQITKSEFNTLLLDAYNANPSSMEVAINNFEILEGDNKVAIIGEMRELGSYSMDEHKTIINRLLKTKSIKQTLLIGDEFCKAYSATQVKTNITCFHTTEEAKNYIFDNKILNSFILIKGSRGMRLETLVENL